MATNNGAKSTPIEPSLVMQIAGGLRYAFTGKAPEWMSPMQPLAPVVPANEQASVQGRQFDFPVGFNTRTKPRQEEPVSFADMRGLADSYDLLRLVIETRKDQIAKMKWDIKPRDPKAKTDARCDAVREMLLFPDKYHTWDDWLRQLVEDLLVIDAPTIYVRPTVGGQPYSFELIDGATIKRVIDEHGRTPLAPLPAYQQILKGVPTTNYTVDELIYKPRNPRTHKIYGFSPVEQIIMTVNIALRRQTSQLQYYTEGSIPDLIMSVPASWNPDQVEKYKAYWDAELQGNTAGRRGTMFVNDGMKPFDTKERALKDEFDEWLARVVCFAFSVSPTPFIKQQNRATAGNATEQALSEGLYPIMQWVKNLADLIIGKHLGAADLEFCWQEEDASNPLDQATINDKKVRNGTMSINEARALDGLDAIEGGDVYLIYTAQGAVTLDEVLNPPEPVALPALTDPNTLPQPTTKYSLLKRKKKVSVFNIKSKIAKAAEIEFKAAALKVFKSLAESVAKQLGELLNKSNADEVQRILKELDLSALVALSDDFEGIYEELVKKVGVETLAKLGIDDADIVNQVNETAVAWAKDRAAEMVGKKWVDGELVDNPNSKWVIEDSTREFLRKEVTDALEEGISTDELAGRMQDAYAFSDARAEMIARTEAANANAQGALIGCKESGVVTGKEWLTADGCCDECAALDGEIVGLDEDFSDGSDAPPEHPNCECTFLAVLDEDMTNESEDE